MDASKYSLGEPAEDAYEALTTGRQSVIDMGRTMAQLTIPSVFPPDGYEPGDDIPGNNQSMGGYALSTLASELMFMAFPPGQPIMKLELQVAKMQAEIDKDPELYARVVLALSQLELAHRKKFLTTPLASAYVGYIRVLLTAGNCLWKHIRLSSPSYHLPTCYVVSRSNDGHPLITIHKERVRVATLDEDVQALVYQNEPELLEEEKREWLRETDIYSVCKLAVGHNSGERTWLYWQEHKGEVIEGTEMETDYEDCPMWPGWMVPVYGKNWGRSYCEEYRGDLFTLETAGSALNDLSALAAWPLVFNKPGARTSIRQLKQARNLDILSGSAEDVSVFRSEKGGDGQFVLGNFDRAARRIGAAFLVQSAVMRDGERVTKEEVQRVGRQLDRAMGGLYTEMAQGNQRRIITRAVKLNEEESPYLPPIPTDTVSIDVITGIDAMGASNDANELNEFGMGINAVFGPGAAAQVLNPSDYATRMASYKGIKPDGLVKKAEEVEAQKQQAQQQAMSADLLSKAAGPTAGALAGALGQQMTTPPKQQP